MIGAVQSPPRATLRGTLLAVLALCSAPSLAPAATTSAQAAAAPVEAGVRVEQAWIRWLPANLPAGGYLTLNNESARTVTLVAVQSPAYASVALHRTLTSGGTARMVAVPGIAVPPHSTLNFASLGYHLMLMQARQAVKPGQQVALTLQFADGGTLHISAQVKPPTAQSGTAAGMQNMPGMSH
ncbi:MAG TPA: copper chaperone PCu(A)C [Steroidobacteraceae bacterium]|nr:copper chaperone PCu(A)C [Steroidobacteraceae bacterium]